MNHRNSFAIVGLVAALGACGGSDPPRFVIDASTSPDATGGSCTSNAQCDDNVACTRDICVVGGTCEHLADSASCVVPMRCTSTAQCDDRVACTRDACLVDGTCSHTPQNDMCSAGQTCDLTRGCSGGSTGTCRADADCRDAYDCTIDACGTDGRCVYTAQNARCVMGQVCRVGMGCIREQACSMDAQCDDNMRCNGAERCVEFGCVAGTPVDCADTDACTNDACVETGAMMCTHTMNPTCMGGAAPRSGIYTLNPGVMYTCASILGKVVVNINMTSIQVTVTPTGITVTGAPATMMGGPVTGGMFSASGSIAGDCVETYSLMGRFASDRMFTGTFTTQYLGLGCGLTNCMARSFPVTGTLAL